MKDQLFIALQHITPHHLLSRLIGIVAECPWPSIKNPLTNWFVKQYNVNMSEAVEENPEAYNCFNDFFTRPLKEGMRPLPEDKNTVVCPADGAISQLGDIKYGQIYQAKGHEFSLTELLGGDHELAAEFQDGKFATVYLSPSDYHRVHMPFGGTLRKMIHVPGRLFSVNQTTAENVPRLFAHNERAVCIFDTEKGPMAVILVGAMIVASIETVWAGLVTPHKRKVQTFDYTPEGRKDIRLERGEEMGRFKLGSTAIVLFGKDQVEWAEELAAETPVQMGHAFSQ
ncbi:archaetidylserine decarboxylase [Sansalvadorimonas sp. 2012CJ34-2]|uniref:Phosphatidylserine decarboxylase proenzyme n=1 Tax=Parendozoicomonas callyspongiae TaxID=2942213 RepID=A0ABT0PL45_9GAMM|nr:archaetidylserine decarboxylase [Sansalvadorimonas sp. 2012CJ34-2]